MTWRLVVDDGLGAATAAATADRREPAHVTPSSLMTIDSREIMC